MPTYVTLLKFTSEGLKNQGDFAKQWKEGEKVSEQMGIKSIGAYGVLGAYDAMFIYEAPNESAVAGLTQAMSTKGYANSETWTIIPMEEFVQIGGKARS